MPDEVLVDTNVLVYAFDPEDGVKQARAIEVLGYLVIGDLGYLSTQVLGEFFVVTTTKLRTPLPIAEAYGRLEDLALAWRVLPITPLIALEAARGVRDHRLPYWDALVWATARLNQIPTILSEDSALSARREPLEGVRCRNPFTPAFTLADLG